MGLAAAAAAALVSLVWAFAPASLKAWRQEWSFCALYRYTGFYCPGCGGSRALSALLHGNILASILYHPLVPFLAALYLAYMATHLAAAVSARIRRGSGKEPYRGLAWRDGYLYAALLILAASFILKNLVRLVTGTDVLAALDRLFGA